MILGEDHPYRHPWLGVEMRHLATLVAVARTKSFRQAAAELGYVQSAVSHQIASLERVVGTRLVERRRGQRTVTLTPAGKLLLERSVGIIGHLHAARVDILAGEGAAGAIIRLAVPSDAVPLLGRLLASVTRELPGVRLRIIETVDDAELIAHLALGNADVAIGSPPHDTALATAILLHDPFVVLTRADSALASLAGVTGPEQLHGRRLIVPEAAVSDADLRAAGLRLDLAVHVPLAATIPPLVASGVGVGLVPQSGVEHAGDGLVALSTAGLIAPRRVVLCWHAARRRPAPLKAFCHVATSSFSAGMSAASVAGLAPVA